MERKRWILLALLGLVVSASVVAAFFLLLVESQQPDAIADGYVWGGIAGLALVCLGCFTAAVTQLRSLAGAVQWVLLSLIAIPVLWAILENWV